MAVENTRFPRDATLLYIEDEPLLREEVAFYLKRRVGHLLLAENGLQGMQLFKLNRVDAIITDLLMPELDGMSLLREIRQSDGHIPFVITTAINDFKTMQEAMQLGVTRFLVKPFQTEQIDEALNVIAETIVRRGNAVQDLTSNSLCSKTTLNKIEAEIAKKMKELTLKGPDRVNLLLCANLLEIAIVGGYSKMEQTLLQNPENQRFVDFYRETFYKHIQVQMKEILQTHLHCHCQLIQVTCSGKKQQDSLKWILDGCRNTT